jgi:hypothetical protein
MGREFAYTTSDGGLHWRPVTRITAPDIREGFSPFQLSPRIAYLLVFQPGVTLYRSTDGDRRWTAVRHWKGP